jgi:hypothetical protein
MPVIGALARPGRILDTAETSPVAESNLQAM